jgi:hypothetical protein
MLETFLLAFSLMSAPLDDPVDHDLSENKLLRTFLVQLALDWEFIDDRERNYIFVDVHNFQADVNTLRTRYRDLKDAPPASDALRFAERSYVSDLLVANRDYRKYVEVRQAGEPHRRDYWQNVLNETDQLYNIWILVRDCSYEYYYITMKRSALLALREKIGPANYYSGCLPPHVPTWRFQSIP